MRLQKLIPPSITHRLFLSTEKFKGQVNQTKLKIVERERDRGRGREREGDLAGVSEAGVEVGLIHPILQVPNPQSPHFLHGRRLMVPLQVRRRHRRSRGRRHQYDDAFATASLSPGRNPLNQPPASLSAVAPRKKPLGSARGKRRRFKIPLPPPPPLPLQQESCGRGRSVKRRRRSSGLYIGPNPLGPFLFVGHPAQYLHQVGSCEGPN